MKTTLQQDCPRTKKPPSPSRWAGFQGGEALAARQPQGWAPRSGRAGLAVMVELVRSERVCLCGKHRGPALLRTAWRVPLEARSRLSQLSSAGRQALAASRGPGRYLL